jgi:hypothetical protein
MADDLKLDISLSKSRGLSAIVGGALAILILALIVVVAMKFIPVRDESGVPRLPGGAPPLSLNTLTTTMDEKTKTVSIEGAVFNRSQTALKGLLASIELKDRYTFAFQTVNVPVQPAELGGRMSGTFRATVDIGDHGLSAYVIQFKLGENGPFVPHRDDHPPEQPPK